MKLDRHISTYKGNHYITLTNQGGLPIGYQICIGSVIVNCWQTFKAMYFDAWSISRKQPLSAKYFDFDTLNDIIYNRTSNN